LLASTDRKLRSDLDPEMDQLFPNAKPGMALGRLPFADVESKRIQARFGAMHITVSDGPEATKALALSTEMSQYSIVRPRMTFLGVHLGSLTRGSSATPFSEVFVSPSKGGIELD
jgi:hypothetical protein